MGRNNMNTEENKKLLQNLRQNVKKNNYSRIADILLEVLRRENSDENKNALVEIIYDEAIKTWINGEETIPKQFENMLLEYAKYEKEIGEKDRALKLLDKIKESQNTKIRKKVKRQINLIKLSQELSKDTDVDEKKIEELVTEIEQEADGQTYMELISSIFGKECTIDKLNLGELEKYMTGRTRKHSDKSDNSTKGKRSYDEELSAENRMKFLREEIDIDSTIRFCDKGIFAGSVLVDIKDTDWVLVEKVINMYTDETYEPNNYGSSTYILPRKEMLELIKLQTKKQVKAELKDEKIGGIAPIQHRKGWKENIKGAIENLKNPLVNQNTEKTEQPETTVEEENTQTEQIIEETAENSINPNITEESRKAEETEKLEKTSKQEEHSTEDNGTITSGVERIVEDMKKNSNNNPIVLNIVRKIQELLARIAELDAEQEKANIDLENARIEEVAAKQETTKRVEAQKIAQEKLKQAIKEEEEASALAKQALEAQKKTEARKDEIEAKQQTLNEEKKRIQDKLNDFLDL